jgi:hypothetical protein
MGAIVGHGYGWGTGMDTFTLHYRFLRVNYGVWTPRVVTYHVL